MVLDTGLVKIYNLSHMFLIWASQLGNFDFWCATNFVFTFSLFFGIKLNNSNLQTLSLLSVQCRICCNWNGQLLFTNKLFSIVTCFFSKVSFFQDHIIILQNKTTIVLMQNLKVTYSFRILLALKQLILSKKERTAFSTFRRLFVWGIKLW